MKPATVQPTFTAYVLHGSGTQGPFQTECAPLRYRPNNDKATRPGPIHTHWQLKTADKWRRLQLTQGHERNHAFVVIDRKRVTVQLVEGVKP